MRAHAGDSTGRFCGDETPYQGLFLKQYGAQRLSLLPQGEFLFISCFFTHMLCAVQVSSDVLAMLM